MSKRAPDQALEELVLSGIGSPRTKRVKTDSIADEEEMLSAEIPANGVGRLSLQPTAQSEGEEDEMDDIMEEEEESEAKKWKDGPPAEFSDLYLDTGTTRCFLYNRSWKLISQNSQSQSSRFRLREALLDLPFQH